MDRVCTNTRRRCQETGTQLGTANVFPGGINVPVGGVEFGSGEWGINLTASDLGPEHIHKLQIFFDTQVAEVSFTVE